MSSPSRKQLLHDGSITLAKVNSSMESLPRASVTNNCNGNADDLQDLSCQITGSLAKAETRSVSILRIAVISVLLLTAGIVSVGVFLYTRNEERTNFTTHFEDSALQVLESFHETVQRNLLSLIHI